MQVVDEEGKQSTVGPEVEETPGPVSGVTKAFRMRECPVCKVGTLVDRLTYLTHSKYHGGKFATSFA